MTAALQTEMLSRLQSVTQLLRIIAIAEFTNHDAGTRSAKGLVFVQMYAVYEYSLIEGVRDVLREFNRRSIPLNNVHHALLPIALDPEFCSVRTTSVDRTWETRAKLLSRMTSLDRAAVNESMFPKDGSFFRMSQLQLLWRILNIPLPVLPMPRLQSHIDELVSNRNAIAHGEKSPEAVGRRYTVSELTSRAKDTELICSHLLSSFAALIANPGSFR